MSVNDQKYNRGTHGVSSFMLDTSVSSSENPLALAVGSVNNAFKEWIADKKEEIPKNIALTEKYPWVRIDGSSDLFTWLDDVPDGWRMAFGEQFCEDFQRVYETFPDEVKEDFMIVEIKEKWGGLRIYCSHETQELEDVLDKYEKLSYKTCIKCGAPAECMTSEYVLPLCKNCKVNIDGDNK